jgi:prepilin signal peptidase PulO-like enzyme (type II secretory pathway)
MGLGDVKLAALIGLVVGFPSILLALFLSFVVGGAVGAAGLLARRIGTKDALPFAPFLAMGGMVALLYGEEILRWYPGVVMH